MDSLCVGVIGISYRLELLERLLAFLAIVDRPAQGRAEDRLEVGVLGAAERAGDIQQGRLGRTLPTTTRRWSQAERL